MTTNARKWQLKCNEIQNLIDGEIMLKEDLQSKLYMTEKKVAVFCFMLLTHYSILKGIAPYK